MKSSLTASQRAELTRILEAKRDEIHRRRRGGPDDRVVEEQADPSDTATDRTAEAEAAGVAANDARILREVEMALQRLADGTYGTSEESGEPISVERLRAVPWARRTAIEEERRERAR